LLEKAQDETFLFIAIEYTGLEPGLMYTARIRGMNSVGKGAWSEASLSAYTRATTPMKPNPPVIESSSLRSIFFTWDTPYDGGSALTGYTVELLNSYKDDDGNNKHKTVDLPRSANYFNWQGLFPGKSYRFRVLAKNAIGDSEYSELNSIENSFTTTAPPEQPLNPVPVHATWNEITLETFLPFNNGSLITSMQVQQRFVEAFEKGDWTAVAIATTENKNSPFLMIPKDVEVLEFVDVEKQQLEIEKMVLKLEMLKKSSGFNLNKTKEKNKIDAEIENLLLKQVFIYF
jgi:hypothetical protein